MLYNIYAGLGGGFGSNLEEVESGVEFATEEDAWEAAWEAACEIYEGYIGLHGLRSVGDIIEQDLKTDPDNVGASQEVLNSMAQEIFEEEREGWLEYNVEEASEDEDAWEDDDDMEEEEEEDL
jgi:hypothetical protein